MELSNRKIQTEFYHRANRIIVSRFQSNTIRFSLSKIQAIHDISAIIEPNRGIVVMSASGMENLETQGVKQVLITTDLFD